MVKMKDAYSATAANALYDAKKLRELQPAQCRAAPRTRGGFYRRSISIPVLIDGKNPPFKPSATIKNRAALKLKVDVQQPCFFYTVMIWLAE